MAPGHRLWWLLEGSPLRQLPAHAAKIRAMGPSRVLAGKCDRTERLDDRRVKDRLSIEWDQFSTSPGDEAQKDATATMVDSSFA